MLPGQNTGRKSCAGLPEQRLGCFSRVYSGIFHRNPTLNFHLLQCSPRLLSKVRIKGSSDHSGSLLISLLVNSPFLQLTGSGFSPPPSPRVSDALAEFPEVFPVGCFSREEEVRLLRSCRAEKMLMFCSASVGVACVCARQILSVPCGMKL